MLSPLRRVKELVALLSRIRSFAEMGPYYLVGPGGFVCDFNGRRFTTNMREAKNFTSWMEADDFARDFGLKWWSILKNGYVDLDLDIPKGIAAHCAEKNEEAKAVVKHQNTEFERQTKRG